MATKIANSSKAPAPTKKVKKVKKVVKVRSSEVDPKILTNGKSIIENISKMDISKMEILRDCNL